MEQLKYYLYYVSFLFFRLIWHVLRHAGLVLSSGFTRPQEIEMPNLIIANCFHS